ncbi:MAG: HAD family hydrolase [Clostridiales bacterium]|nr:HAD family hydrolase [Clostridiales bacterium]
MEQYNVIAKDDIKLVISDLDGTLIPEGGLKPEKEFFPTLDKLLNDGYEFYAASGRTYSSMRRIFGNYRNRIGFVCENGSLIREDGETLYMNRITDEVFKAVSAEMIRDPRVEFYASGPDHVFIMPKREWFETHVRDFMRADYKVISSVEEIDEPIIKMAMYVYDFDVNRAPVQRLFTDRYGKFGSFIMSGNSWIDFILNGSGKGRAIRHLLELKGLKEDEIMVFGDNENDISMFKLTDNSFVKEESADKVKAYANYECSSVSAELTRILDLE